MEPDGLRYSSRRRPKYARWGSASTPRGPVMEVPSMSWLGAHRRRVGIFARRRTHPMRSRRTRRQSLEPLGWRIYRRGTGRDAIVLGGQGCRQGDPRRDRSPPSDAAQRAVLATHTARNISEPLLESELFGHARARSPARTPSRPPRARVAAFSIVGLRRIAATNRVIDEREVAHASASPRRDVRFASAPCAVQAEVLSATPSGVLFRLNGDLAGSGALGNGKRSSDAGDGVPLVRPAPRAHGRLWPETRTVAARDNSIPDGFAS